ncbi:MAG TPA: zinc ribbon domain-containing protein [Bacillota bacterium]|nr:zinc ribbon domain-containing protein [Candidatus Fermentithermobacillaceae bacterium]HPZ85682.1 zinc ribbon domain-containing protein [Bacillota bacterium]
MSQDLEKKGRDLLSRLSRTIRTGAETLVQETKELTRVGRLKVELMSLENERAKKFEEIGRLAHTLYKQGGSIEELHEHFEVIDEIEAKIDAKNKEIEKAPAEEVPEAGDVTPPQDEAVSRIYCTQCGAPADPDDKFCAKCGNQLQ